MHHYFNSITNAKGDALTGYYVKCVDTTSGDVVDIYADSAATPIVSVSGLANAAQVDSDGNVSLYVDVGTYHLDIYATDGTTLIRRISEIPMNIDEDTAAAAEAAKDDAEEAADDAANSAAQASTYASNSAASAATALAAAAGLDPSEYYVVTPQMYGATGDGTTDDGAAFVAAIAALKAAAINIQGTTYKASTKLFIPAGHYYLGTTTLDITHTLIIEGEGGFGFGGAGAATKLRWAADATGIRIQANNTSGAGTVDGVAHFTGANSIVRDVLLVGGYTGANASSTYPGIHAKATFTLERVTCHSFQGDGFYGVATLGSGIATEGNINNSRVFNCSFVDNGKNGSNVGGADANVITFLCCNATGNAEIGFNDTGFLGNIYAGCHAEANGDEPVKTTNANAQHVITAFYEEGNGAVASFSATTQVIGGQWVTGAPTGGVWGDATATAQFRVNNDMIVKARNGGTVVYCYLDSTAQQILVFSEAGTGKASIRQADSRLYYEVNSGHKHDFRVNSANIADLDVNGFGVIAGGLGYRTGAGGAVTQLTSKATGVTLNKSAGQITMNNAALAAGAKVSFVVTNSLVAATDAIIPSVASGGTANAYRADVTAVAAGSFTITVENITGGSLGEAPVINFAVIKAVAA